MDIAVVLLIIISVIGSLVSAASQAKKKQQQQQQSGQQRPRPVMSDIQRAFMMMTGLEEENEQAAQQRAPARYNAPPERQPAVQYYAPAPAAAPAQGYTVSSAGEGSSNFGTVKSGSIVGETLISQEVKYSRPDTVAESLLEARSTAIAESQPTAYELESEVFGDDLSLQSATGRTAVKPRLKLFQSQSDYVRAVIYSEILSRGPRGRRA